MADVISFNEQEYAGATAMCAGCAENLLSQTPEHPSFSGDSAALLAFMRKMADVGTVVSGYKAVLESDVAALREAGEALVEADAALASSLG